MIKNSKHILGDRERSLAMQRRLSMLFICVLLFQTMISGISPSLVKAEGKQQSIFTDSILTDEEGNKVKLEDVSAGAPVHINIGWSVKDKDIRADSNEKLQLPAELEFSEPQEGELGKEGSAIGTYQATSDGILTVQISNEIDNYPEASGTIVLSAVKSTDSTKANEQDASENPPEGESETSSPVTDENENTTTEPVAEEENGTEKQNPDKEKEKLNAESTNETTKIEDSAKEKDTKIVDGEDSETEKNLVQPAAQEVSGFNLLLDAVTDLDGNPYTEESLLEPKDQFWLNLDWNLENGHTYTAGDKQVFQLPKGIKVIEEISGELKDATGLTVATYKITKDKKVELIFTDYVETHSNVTGWIQIISQLDEKNVDVEDGEAIIDPIGEEGEIRIPIVQGESGKTIEKKGTPNKGYNADEINWEVIINKNRTSLTNATITDILPAGTEYKEGSLKVTKLKVDLYGNVLGDAEEVDVTGELFANGELSIPLGNIKDAYRVEYVTTVTDEEKKEFTNNAILSDDRLEDVSAKSTATINRGEAIKKKAAKSYNPKTGVIEWEIEFNYNEKNLNDVTLKDAWTPAGKLELVEDSLKFTEVTIDEEGDAHATGNVGLPEGAQLVPGTDQFEVTGITTTKPYKVTYQTKVKDRVLDPFEVANTAGFGTETAKSGTQVGAYYGSKSAGTVDYKNKTIDWKIEINHDEYPIENISIKDTLGEGLALKEDTLKVTVDGADYKDFSISGDNPFTIQFPNDFTTDKKIVITYQTSYVADEVPEYKPTNTAAITWTPEGSSDSMTKKVTAGTELNNKTKNNDWKNGSYDPETKEITWTIYTNYRENEIGNLIVKDAPQGNQKIVADSIVVKELAIDEKGNISEGNELTNGISVDSEQNTFQVTIGETNKAHKIEYKTSLVGLSDIQTEYVNKAEVLDGETNLSNLDAKVGIAKAETYGEKSGYQDGKQVHWSVKVNLGQQKINNLKLVDTISANQEYLTNTIKVYKASVDTNGKATKGEEISPEQYQLTHTTGEPDFTIIWKNEVERAFIVEYSTLFFAGHNEDVTNNYEVTGDNIVDDGKTNGDGSVTIKQLASGGGNGEAGYLVVDKVDTTYGKEETSLEGAEFDLIDADTGNVLKSGTTDENGQIDFGRLLFGEYELHERVVPDGYVTKNERQTIIIDKKYEQNNEQTKTTYRVENFVPVYAIELIKTDNKSKALQDAEFTLYDGDKKELAKATTNQDGKILFENLKEAGTYYVQETKAPKGFVLDSTEHKVVIGDKEPEPVKVSVTNKPRGAVVLTKKDLDSDIALKGVEFALQKQDDTGDYQTIATLTTDDKGKIRTSNTLEAGNYQFVETKGLDGYRTNGTPIKFTVNVNSTKDQQLTMKNERYKGSVELVKKDDVTDATLKNATFKLVKADGELVKENLTTNNQGELRIDDLFLGKYQLIETKAPAGYRLEETPIDIDITEDNQVIEKVMTNEKITDITVEKKWNNSSGDNESVTVKLLPTDQTVKLSEKNDWKATFKDLSVYDEAGEAIDYQVEELNVDGYNSAVTGDRVNGFIITNTETTTVEGTKTWLDDGSADRPDAITVKLLANGGKVATTEVKAANDWKYSFKDLDKYDANGEEIAYTIEEVPVEGYETTVNGFDLENLRVGTVSVKGEKIWQDEDPTDRPEEITVNLKRNIDGVEDKSFSKNKTVKPNNQGKWVYTFTDLAEFDEHGAAYTYTVKETNVPEKYEAKIDGYDIINTRVGTTEVSGKKRWKDDKITDRPETITINLLRNNVVVDTTQTTADDDWVYRFQDLPKYDNKGQLYDYTVKEQDVKGYDSQVSGFDITNTRAEKKSIEVTKGWLDDNSKDRPTSIIVYLKQNGELFDTLQLKAEDDWTYVFNDLEAYDENGQEYAYTVEEKALEGYETKIDGFNITNLRVGKTDVTGTKTWLDDNSPDRPESITVKLLANGEETNETATVSADSDWKYAFTDLEKYDDQGKEIAYTVDEEVVEGYKKSISNNNITNLRVGKTAVTAEKIWNEVDERYRPDHVTINLLANGEVIDTQIVTADTDWMYTFSDLEKYDEQGKEITYTVKENDVPAGYDADVDDYKITNTQKSTEVIGTKEWIEVDERYRPDSITVQLLANGEKEATVEVSENTNWTYAFTNLAKYDKAGEEITYTVEELDVPTGYKSTVDKFNITNSQKSTKVTGEKTWSEVDERYRPDSITVQLLANGEKEATLEVSAETDWKYAFTDLAKYDKTGEEITYTVEEMNVPTGYEAEVDGYNITNTQKSTEVTGEKTWEEVDERYRPDTITVNLLANGVAEQSAEVSKDTDWSYTFTDLAKYDKEGNLITYTIKEDAVTGYTSTVSGHDVTNTQQTTEVSGMKTWLDDESADRPDIITVQVKNGEEIVQSLEVTAEDDWSYTFKDLPKYDKAGKEINYSINEKAVDGYKTIINGFDITNLRADVTVVEGEKIWKNDSPAERPEAITVILYANDKELKRQKVTKEMDWKYTFASLQQFDDEGKAIVYTVGEKPVDGYDTEVNGFTIINTLKPNDPISPNDPEDTDDPAQPTISGGASNSGNELPNTATNIFNIFMIGAGFLLAGFALWIYKRKFARD